VAAIDSATKEEEKNNKGEPSVLEGKNIFLSLEIVHKRRNLLLDEVRRGDLRYAAQQDRDQFTSKKRGRVYEREKIGVKTDFRCIRSYLGSSTISGLGVWGRKRSV